MDLLTPLRGASAHTGAKTQWKAARLARPGLCRLPPARSKSAGYNGTSRVPPPAKVALHRSSIPRYAWSDPPVNDHDYQSLFASLNQAVEILHRNRRPDPQFVAAFDTLKQSRAMLVSVLNRVETPVEDRAAA
jgi:hypothetical protein